MTLCDDIISILKKKNIQFISQIFLYARSPYLHESTSYNDYVLCAMNII